MGDLNQVRIVRSGQAAVTAWRIANPDARLALDGESFRNADLRAVDFHDADARDASFVGAQLGDANFRNADLRGAQFDRADLSRADLSRADFTGANLTGATASGANVAGAVGANRLTQSSRQPSSFGEWAFSMSIIVLAAISIGAIVGLIWWKPVGVTTFARGLITVIFAVGTVSLALILVASRWLATSQDAGDRFQHSKEVLTLFVGIFGTVVGWYFGQTSPTELAPQISTAQASRQKVMPGQETMLTVLLSGGVPPYRYTAHFDEHLVPDVSGTTSETVVQIPLTVPAQTAPGNHYAAHVIVTDANGRSAALETAKEPHIEILPGLGRPREPDLSIESSERERP